MLYTSLVNWVVFTVAVGVFWLLHGRARVMWFAAGSLIVLALNDVLALGVILFVLVVAMTAPAAYGAVRRSRFARPGTLFVAGASMYGAILLPLLAFKSPDGLSGDLLGARAAGLARLAVPLGISYFTIRAVMYVRAVTRGEVPAQRLDNLVCYLAFPPTASAGPIDTPHRFFGGLRRGGRLSSDEFVYAASRIVAGAILKFLVADNLQVPISTQFRPSMMASSPLHLLVFGPLYSLYLYTEFSGYSHMAIGAAALVGVESPENFARPLTRTDISDFWRSWHMSLTSFLRTHVFLPVAFVLSRHTSERTAAYTATAVTFVLCGAWHGMAWNFILWGAYHAALLVGHQAFREVSRKLTWLRRLARHRWYPAAAWCVTFAAVSAGWVLFYFDISQLSTIFHLVPLGGRGR